MTDLVATRFFVGAAGKAHARIAAMMFDASGNVYSWYDDGTTYVGVPQVLGATSGARTYTLPAGKTAGDLVAVALRPAGGVIAFYRDGTKSEGTATDLDAYAGLTSVELGAKDPADILAIDTYANGQTVTLFAHDL